MYNNKKKKEGGEYKNIMVVKNKKISTHKKNKKNSKKHKIKKHDHVINLITSKKQQYKHNKNKKTKTFKTIKIVNPFHALYGGGNNSGIRLTIPGYTGSLLDFGGVYNR